MNLEKISSLKTLLAWSLVLCFYSLSLLAETGRYRLVWHEKPQTEARILWEEIKIEGGENEDAKLYYDTIDHGKDLEKYAHKVDPTQKITQGGMNNSVAFLKDLSPDSKVFFVIASSKSSSPRFWFKTASDKPTPFAFVAGGDSRTNPEPRRLANKAVAKLRPLFVLFGGDYTEHNTDKQWQSWLDDWQLTTSEDGRMTPLLPVLGNHEKIASGSSKQITLDKKRSYAIFSDDGLFFLPKQHYYASEFGGNLLRVYALDSNERKADKQKSWLEKDLSEKGAESVWRFASYHKPMVPCAKEKKMGKEGYDNWAQAFYDYRVNMVLESDSHTVKRTWPLKPSQEQGSEKGFIRSETGTVFVGEGTWGAPMKTYVKVASWIRDGGRFAQFKWIHVYPDKMELRCVKYSECTEMESLDDAQPFVAPKGTVFWQPENGEVVLVKPWKK